ncbi:MAG TPA: ABC transporter permease [Pseudobdellovibrionaceae bacterium]|nr:ABC transporter permease [Pseudobdellovibrionaceae bacterium]
MRILLSVRNRAVEFTKEVGDMVLFLLESLRLVRTKPSRFPEIVQHMEFIGNQSIGIIMLTSLFTGLALSFQIYLGFKIVNMVNLSDRPWPWGSAGNWVPS